MEKRLQNRNESSSTLFLVVCHHLAIFFNQLTDYFPDSFLVPQIANLENALVCLMISSLLINNFLKPASDLVHATCLNGLRINIFYKHCSQQQWIE